MVLSQAWQLILTRVTSQGTRLSYRSLIPGMVMTYRTSVRIEEVRTGGGREITRGVGTGTIVGIEIGIGQAIVVGMAIEDDRTIIAQGEVKIVTVPFRRKTIFLMDVIHHRRLRGIDFYGCSKHH